tara:strand:- start:10000 stop:10956 length:957 start_codon:yes stop_codon:yes gene_type:complete
MSTFEADHENRSLVLVRTPFQAWLVMRVLKEEGVGCYDVIYFTQNNSEEDRHYFSLLEASAKKSLYLFVPPGRLDIFSHILFRYHSRYWSLDRGYRKVFLSSINAPVPNAIASAQSSAQMISYDDGAANIFSEGDFYKEKRGLRAKFYRLILGAQNLSELKKRIFRHYTIYDGYENVVEKNRLVLLKNSKSETSNTDEIKSYFIGAPFREVLTSDQIRQLTTYMESVEIDAYVRHPREKQPLNLAAPFLEKRGKVAEQAILDDARGRKIILFGFLSSVMFNMASCVHKRIVFVPKGASRHIALIELAEKSGCEVVRLP